MSEGGPKDEGAKGGKKVIPISEGKKEKSKVPEDLDENTIETIQQSFGEILNGGEMTITPAGSEPAND